MRVIYVCMLRVALRAGCPRLSSLHDPNPPRKISDPNLSNVPGPIQTAHGQVWPWDWEEEAPRTRAACACPVPTVRARTGTAAASGSRRRARAALLPPDSAKKKKPIVPVSSPVQAPGTAPHTTPTPTRPREAALEWSGADGYRTRHAGSRRPGART